MAYNEELAKRIRYALGPNPNITEKRMFGGLAFLINGKLAIAASGQGGILVRVDPEQIDKLLSTTNAEIMVMKGRPMSGWLRVNDELSEAELDKWIELSTSYVGTLLK